MKLEIMFLTISLLFSALLSATVSISFKPDFSSASHEGNRFRHRKMKIIPADEDLLRPVIPEEVENRMAHAEISKLRFKKSTEDTIQDLRDSVIFGDGAQVSKKNSESLTLTPDQIIKIQNAIRKKRQSTDDVQRRACIYIDIPGSHPGVELEAFIPENLDNCRVEQNQETLQVETTETTESEDEKEVFQSSFKQEENDADVNSVYWLKIPPSGPGEQTEMISKLYKAIDDLHHEGKDVLFIPIAKGFSNTTEVHNGFLKSLNIDPELHKRRKYLKFSQFS